MKKLAVFSALVLLVFLSSCAKDFDYLEYQRGSVRALCTINEKYEVVITKSEACSRLEILVPKELCGTYFELYESSAYAVSGEIKIPIDKNVFSGIYALLGAFSLDGAAQGSVSDEDGKSIVCFDTEHGTYVITYGKNLMPSHIEIHSDKFDYDIDVKEIEIGDIR